MIKIDDGPEPYSRGAVAESYIRDGFDVTIYPPADACLDDISGIDSFVIAESEEQTVVVYILIGTELVDNVALMNAARRAKQRDDLRFDT